MAVHINKNDIKYKKMFDLPIGSINSKQFNLI